MEKKILDFLEKQRVCSLTTLLEDRSPHAAALHYSHKDESLEIYISTENNSRKCEALLDGRFGRAAFVIGFSEVELVTLQMDGDVRIVTDKKELEEIHKVHYKKHPDSEKWKDDPATVFLVFTPTWWRYTEYKPKFVVIESK